MNQTPEQSRMAVLIVDALNLEDIDPADIDPEELMFGDEGLALDSIDALEIAVAIAEEFAVHFSAKEETTREAFATLGNLTDFVMKEVNART